MTVIAARFSLCVLLLASFAASGAAQAMSEEGTTLDTPTPSTAFIRWQGTLPEFSDRTLEMQFALFRDQYGGSPLWTQIQQVSFGPDGRYSVVLGRPHEGIPVALFPADDTRWVEVIPLSRGLSSEAAGFRAVSATMRPRTMVVSVPYALTAANAEMLGGRPASDYATLDDLNGASAVRPVAMLMRPIGPASSTLPVTAGGTGATSAASALSNLGAQPALPGVGSDNANGIEVTGSVTASRAQGEWLGSPSVDPAATIASACGSSSPAVYFPAGVYATAGNIALCSGLHIRCAGSDVVGAATGSVFQLTPGAGAVWLMRNPNAGAAGGSPNVRDVRIEGCTLDIANDPAALGALNMEGISWSSFDHVDFHSNGNANPVITFDGAGYKINNGDYNNDFFGVTLYDDSSTASDIGVYVTDSSNTASCSNENHWYGGSIQRYGTAIKIDCGNGNTFASVDLENWRNYGVWLSSQSSGGGAAFDNWIVMPRLESSAPASGIGIEIDVASGIKFNHIDWPQHSGTYTFQVDKGGSNSCLGCLYGPPSSPVYATLLNNAAQNGMESVGINRTPAQLSADGVSQPGGLDVGGNLNVTGSAKVGGAAVPTVSGSPAPTTIACWKSGSPPTLGSATIVNGAVSACN